MVSEVDCVINAARPLDGSARDAFLREVASSVSQHVTISPIGTVRPRSTSFSRPAASYGYLCDNVAMG